MDDEYVSGAAAAARGAIEGARVVLAQRDAAWARLVKAERSAVSCGAYDEVDVARQALRDLGVDVDALLGAP